jgi:ribosomal protein L20
MPCGSACQWLFGVLLFGILLPVSFLGLGVLFFTRYKNHVIFYRRNPSLVSIEVLAMLFAFSMYCLKFIFNDVNTDVTAILYFLGGFVGLTAIMFRLISLYLALTVSLHVATSQRRLTAHETWWMKNKKYFNARNGFIFSMLLLGIGLSVFVFLLNAFGSSSAFAKSSFAALVYWILVAAFILYLTRLLQTAGSENFGIKLELKRKTLCGVLVIVGIVLSLSKDISRLWVENGLDLRLLLSWPAIFLEVYITVWQVVFDIWVDSQIQAKYELETDSGVRALQLEDILKDKTLRSAFHDFLCRELSVEHLLFIQEHQKWINKWQNPSMEENPAAVWSLYVKDTRVLYQEFVDAGAVASVNISSKTRFKCKEVVNALSQAEVGNVDATIFSDAQEEVHHLLSFDSMMRFKKDPKFKDLWMARLAAKQEEARISNSNFLERTVNKTLKAAANHVRIKSTELSGSVGSGGFTLSPSGEFQIASPSGEFKARKKVETKVNDVIDDEE